MPRPPYRRGALKKIGIKGGVKIREVNPVSKLCLEVTVQVFGQSKDASRVGASKGVNHFGVNTKTKEEESHGEGWRTIRAVSKKRVKVVGEFGDRI